MPLSLICFVLYACPLTAQNSSFVFEQYGKLQGLPGKTTTTVYQDSRNFLWIGTEHGLVRFDGKFFKHYNQIGEGGITDRIVTCITEDAAGNIWFGTESGLNKLNPFTNIITQFNEGSGPGTIPYHWCNILFTDSRKQLWLTTEKGIALYNSSLNSFTNYPVTVAGKDEKINKFINQVVQDRENNLWLSTSYGIKKFNPVTKQYQSYHKEETTGAAGENVFYGICIDAAGSIWAITFGGQLFRYNPVADKFECVFTAPDKQMRFGAISSFKNENNHSLLIATSNGLLQLNPANLQQAPQVMLQGSNLTRVFTDRQQNIWLASSNGLYRHSAISLAVQWLRLPAAEKPFVYHFIPVTGNPQEFFLTTTDGWYRYNSSTQKITAHTLPADKRALLKNINHFTADETGYWFTSVNGFGYYNTVSNQLTDLTEKVEKYSGQAITGYIISPVKNQLWLTLRRTGIMVYNTVTKKDTLLFGDKEKPGNVFGKGISDLQLGPDKMVWFVGGGKLYRIDPVTLAFKTFSTSSTGLYNSKLIPFRMLFTKNGRIIVNSQSDIYELKNEKLELVYPPRGLLNFSLYSLQEDETGAVWAVADDGLYKTNQQFSVWKNMNSIPGLENEWPGFEINLSLPGKVLLGSEGRIGILTGEKLRLNSNPLPVMISRIRLGGQEQFFAAPAACRCNFKDAVEIELAAPDFNNEKENTFLYRLEGWDKEWKVLAGQNSIRYEQLPAGSYTFSAKSVNAEGRESAVTTFLFSVIPPFYRSWWFIALLIAAVSATVYMVYRYRLQKALELEKIRTRIATDLHDDIGATLSSISVYSEALKKQVKEKLPHLEPVLEKMGENSRDMVTGMSDIVWAINPDNDAGGKLLQRMENYATDICAAKEIKLEFTADDKLKQLLLAPEQRKNIYLIFKEAVNNAVKYADARNMHVKLQLLQKQLTVTIADDGCGFDFDTIKKGNGLNNMQLRAAELNGQLLVEGAAEGGTRILLRVTV